MGNLYWWKMDTKYVHITITYNRQIESMLISGTEILVPLNSYSKTKASEIPRQKRVMTIGDEVKKSVEIPH